MSDINESGSVVVSWDFSKGKDVGVLLVGKKAPGKDVEIINAFQGEEAEVMYRMLTTVKKKEGNMNIEFKEVNFEKYCKTCKYGKGPEKDDICNECLAEPMNSETEVPVNWKGEK